MSFSKSCLPTSDNRHVLRNWSVLHWAIPDNNEPPPMEDIGIPYFFFHHFALESIPFSAILHWNPYFFRQCSWNSWLLFATGLGNSDTFLIWFLEFHTISSYFQFGMREGRYRGHWNSRHFWSCLCSGFLYLFPLTYSGRYRGHWNSIQFCIHVIVWFWMLLKTRQYNQHDTGREKLLCEYGLMKT